MRTKIYCDQCLPAAFENYFLCCKLSCPQKENCFILYAFESTNVNAFCLKECYSTGLLKGETVVKKFLSFYTAHKNKKPEGYKYKVIRK